MKMALKLLSILSLVIIVTCQYGKPVVRVAHGIIQGTWKQSTNGRQYASFDGVPYARPPVGKYRFREPQKLKPWAGVWEANRPPPKCIQYNGFSETIIGSEDCLYLNVATPKPHGGASLPVMIFIHGGAFMFGEGILYSLIHLMDRDIVVVTINHRLGPLGFLSTGDQASPGNAGLKDQTFALQWVKNNINKFGGNPDSITLTGLSAGGASVHYHYLSPLSKGLFHRGIAFSGSALASWTYAAKPLRNAKTLASIVGCPVTNTCDMVECLRSRPAEMIVNAQFQMFDWRVNLFTIFTPTREPVGLKEPAFLTQYPYQAMQNGCMARIPLITTVTTEEGLYPAARYLTDPTILPELESRWEDLASNIFVYNDTLPLKLRTTVAAKIKQYYIGGKAISQETFPQLVQALGDRLFVVDAGKLAQLHAATSGQPTYVYRYAYRASVSFTDFITQDKKNYGVSHVDDVNLVLKLLPGLANTTQDIKMREALLDMIYSYATTGVPKLSNGVRWIPVQPGSSKLNYLAIASADNMSMKTNNDFGHRSFWDSLGFIENERYYMRLKDKL